MEAQRSMQRGDFLKARVVPCVISLVLAGCYGAYEPPCKIKDRRTILAEEVSFNLTPLPSGQILALGQPNLSIELLEQHNSSETRVEVVLLSPDGDLDARWSLLVPNAQDAAAQGSGFGLSSGMRFLWLEDALAGLSMATEELPEDEEGPHTRLVLSWTLIPVTGPAGQAVEVPETECTDCYLLWTASSLNQQTVILFAHGQPMTTINPIPTAPPVVQFLIVDSSGQVLQQGQLDWLPDTLARIPPSIDVNSRATGFVLSSGAQRWLVDADLELRAGPFTFAATDMSLPQKVPIDWGSEQQLPTAGWGEAENILWARFFLDGSPSGKTKRISSGQEVECLRASGDQVAVAFWDGGTLFLAVSGAEGHKLGGDVEIKTADEATASSLSRQSLFAGDSASELALFLASQDGIERIEVGCAQ